jgi:hypothetical protein
MTAAQEILSLSHAVAEGRLEDFIKQEEKRGIDAADKKEFEALLNRASKSRRSGGRASRSSSGGGLSGK